MLIQSPRYIEPRTGENHLSLNGAWMMGCQDEPVADPAAVQAPYTVTVPGTVYRQLFECGQMPDPCFGTNCKLFGWVDDKLWVYKKNFRLDRPCRGQALLCFDGVVYSARVWLNGTLLGEHKGMFGGPVIEVSSLLNAPGDNELVLEVRAANFRDPAFTAWNKDLSVPHPVAPWHLIRDTVTLNGDFNVIGPWRDVRLEFLEPVHLSRPYITADEITGNDACLTFEAEITDPAVNELQSPLSDPAYGWTGFINSFRSGNIGVRKPEVLRVRIRITDRQRGKQIYCQDEDYRPFDWTKSLVDPKYYECHYYRRRIRLENIRLWWPAALGEPNLYECHVSLYREDALLDEQRFVFGIRSVERAEGAGEKFRARWDKFHFIINGQKVFLRGVNWMPLDSFLRFPKEEYRWTLEAARDMGVMLIRVWSGGGVPESNDFYDLCDELGIMVWQDQPIANTDTCNEDPDVLLEQVSLNLYRIRNHPSLAVICGGNEHNPYSRGNLAAMNVIDNAVHDLVPDRQWVRASPDRGSAHIYMDMEPTWYREITRQVPFVAESGIHSFPGMKAWREVISKQELSRPLSDIFTEEFSRNNPELRSHFAEFSPDRIPRMLSRASAISDIRGISLPDLCEATHMASYEFYQIMAEALRENYPVTTGLMPWVFRRPSVAVGIQLMDAGGNPIAPYYALKNAYRDLSVSLRLPHLTWKAGETVPLKAAVLNARGGKLSGLRLTLTVLSPELKRLETRQCTVDISGAVTDADFGTLKIGESFRDRYFFLYLTLENGSEVLARKLYWPRALSLMDDDAFLAQRRAAPAPNLQMDKGPWLKPQVQAAGTTSLHVSVTQAECTADRQTVTLAITNDGPLPAFPVVPDLPAMPCAASDSAFILMPGETRNISLTGFRRGGVLSENAVVSAWNAPVVTVSLR